MSRPFEIIIVETRTKHITVEAESVAEAVEIVEELYRDGNFSLTVDDVEDVEFEIQEDIENPSFN